MEKSNFEKKVAGELYRSQTEELDRLRLRVRQLCFEYNNTPPNEPEKRKKLFHEIFPNMAPDAWMEPDIQADYGLHVTCGKHFYANFNCVMLDVCPITIGDDCMFGPNVSIYTPLHPLFFDERKIQEFPDGVYDLEYGKPVHIGNRVWLGGNVTVLPGVTIGDNCVIGAGSVVVKDIPAGYLAVGNPCKPVRKITEKDRMWTRDETKFPHSQK